MMKKSHTGYIPLLCLFALLIINQGCGGSGGSGGSSGSSSTGKTGKITLALPFPEKTQLSVLRVTGNKNTFFANAILKEIPPETAFYVIYVYDVGTTDLVVPSVRVDRPPGSDSAAATIEKVPVGYKTVRILASNSKNQALADGSVDVNVKNEDTPDVTVTLTPTIAPLPSPSPMPTPIPSPSNSPPPPPSPNPSNPPPPPPPPPPPSGWHYCNPTSMGYTLYGIWGYDANNIYMVGYSGALTKKGGPPVSPSPRLGNYYAISGTGATAYAAFGDYKDASSAIVTKTNDNTNFYSSPLGAANDTIYGAFALNSDSVYAVGAFSSNKIFHLYGGVWNAENIPVAGMTLYGVWGTATDNDVYAVGVTGGNGYIFRHNGGTHVWTQVYGPVAGTPLNAIWGANSGNIFVAGINGANGVIYNGSASTWSLVDTATNIPLYGIWVRDAANVFCTGLTGSDGKLYKYNGATGTTLYTATGTSLRAVWGNNTNVYAVGQNGVIVGYDGATTKREPGGIVDTINGMWGSTPNNVYAVCNNGTIMNYNGSNGVEVPSGTAQNLNGIWGFPDGNAVAVGNAGTVLTLSGGTWASLAGAPVQQLNGVWGTSLTDFIVVGGGGTIRWYNGGWINLDSAGTWNSICAFDQKFIVGNGGNIRHFDGAWHTDTAGTSNLYSVWGTSSGDVFAVGQGGVIYHHSGPGCTWVAMTSPTALDLRCVRGKSSTDVFAVGGTAGTNGVVLHYDGTSWVDITAQSGLLSGVRLNSISGFPPNILYIGGEKGTIIENGP